MVISSIEKTRRFRVSVLRRLWALGIGAVLLFACGGDSIDSPDNNDPPNDDGVLLPFVVDDYFSASGYMGDGSVGGVIHTDTCLDPRPGAGKGGCHNFTWTPAGQGWAGVFWQFPEGNWGDDAGLPIAAGASKVEFYAWGSQGGETIKFIVGMGDVDPFSIESEVVLTTEPTLVSIDISQQTYDKIVGGLGWVGGVELNPSLTFSIDDVQWK